MTENEAKDILRVTGWNRAEEGDIEGVEAIDIAMSALEEIQSYRAIGTIEEFKVLKEKNEPKKPIRVSDYTLFELWHCPSCTTYVAIDTCCCEKCGQRLNWSE